MVWAALAFYCAVAVAELSLVSMSNVVAAIVAVLTIAAFVLVRLICPGKSRSEQFQALLGTMSPVRFASYSFEDGYLKVELPNGGGTMVFASAK